MLIVNLATCITNFIQICRCLSNFVGVLYANVFKGKYEYATMCTVY